MRMLDINILVYAHREDSPNHPAFRNWLEQCANSAEAFGLCDAVLAGFLRVTTHPRIFSPPSPIDKSIEFVRTLLSLPNCVLLNPGARHWKIFEDLCLRTNAKGNTVPDAYLAALAIESGSLWITTDGGFGRFPELRWKHPLQ